MIKSAGQVSPHVHVCFGTWAAPLTSPNSWKFSVKSCLLLHDSAREPLSLPNQDVFMLQLDWSPAQHCQVPRLGRASVGAHLPQAGKHGMGSIQPLAAHSLSCSSSCFWSHQFSSYTFLLINSLLLELSALVIIPAATKCKFSAVQMTHIKE